MPIALRSLIKSRSFSSRTLYRLIPQCIFLLPLSPLITSFLLCFTSTIPFQLQLFSHFIAHALIILISNSLLSVGKYSPTMMIRNMNGTACIHAYTFTYNSL